MTTSRVAWEDAWSKAQQHLTSIRNTLNTHDSSDSRVIRVGQLDSELLDHDLVHLLQEPLNKALSLINISLKARFEPELGLLIQLVLYKLSIWNTGASYGAKLQNLRYVVHPPPEKSFTSSGLPRRTLAFHATLTVILPYLHTRLRTHALSSAWPDAPSSDRRRKAWNILTTLEASYTFLSLSNFGAFLWNGRFRTIADRVLRMRLIPSSRLINREISYEFMNRQMVWHAFTEFLLFLLPIISMRSIRRRMNRIASYISSSALVNSTIGYTRSGSTQITKGQTPIRRGKYWSLPQDQCAICAENASINLDFSAPANILSSLSAVPASSSDSLASIESGPPAFPIYNPYIASCGDIYCYHCIAERMVQAVDAGEDESSWQCLRCTTYVRKADRYVVEIESDASGSDYDFSGISGSMGSCSESE